MIVYRKDSLCPFPNRGLDCCGFFKLGVFIYLHSVCFLGMRVKEDTHSESQSYERFCACSRDFETRS